MFIQTSHRSTKKTKASVLCGVMLLTLGFVHSLNAETPNAPKGSLSHQLGELELSLDNQEQFCKLQYVTGKDDPKVIPLLLEAPCYWITGSETKQPLHFSYTSVGVDNTLLVAGTRLDWSDEKKSYHKLPEDAYCTQYLQGVVISGSNTFAVDEKMVAAHCETGLAMDEKIFYAMAHNPERYQKKSADTIKKEAAQPMAVEKAKEKALETPPAVEQDKSFLDSVTDTIKGLFSDEAEDAK